MSGPHSALAAIFWDREHETKTGVTRNTESHEVHIDMGEDMHYVLGDDGIWFAGIGPDGNIDESNYVADAVPYESLGALVWVAQHIGKNSYAPIPYDVYAVRVSNGKPVPDSEAPLL